MRIVWLSNCPRWKHLEAYHIQSEAPSLANVAERQSSPTAARRQRWGGKETMKHPATLSVRGGAAVRVQRLVRRFSDWPDAFSVCREMNKPITVAVPVNDVIEVARIFPSGRCKHLRYESPNDKS